MKNKFLSADEARSAFQERNEIAYMTQDPLTLYKLIVLYMLNRVTFPLTRNQITDFIQEKEYTNFFTLQQVMAELIDTGLVTAKTVRNRTLLDITDEGLETLRFFENRVSDAIKKDIDNYLTEKELELRDEVSIQGDYYKSVNGEYAAHLIAKEKGVPGELKMEPEMVRAVCEKAHAEGYIVSAHVESPEGVRMALENGVDSIEHGAKLDEEMITLFKEKHAFLCTTLSPALPYALFDRAITNASEVEQYNGNVVFEGIIDCAKTALANDIPVVLGNDVGCPWITQYDFWRELYYFHKYVGVSNAFALYTATKRSAEMAGIDDITGSIEKGKCADMIVTSQNPLEDLRALRHVDMVIANGILIRDPKIKKKTQVEAELDKFIQN